MAGVYWKSPQMVASVLDHKYKRLKFLSDEQREQVYDIIKQEMQLQIQSTSTDGNTETNDAVTSEILYSRTQPVKVKQERSTSPMDEASPVKKVKSDVFNYLMGDIVDISDDEESDSHKLEFSQYMKDINKGDNSVTNLEWWKTHATKYPRLASIARRYLSMPATSVSSERAFSVAGNTVTKLRANISSEVVDEIIFLNKNMKNEIIQGDFTEGLSVKMESFDSADPALPVLRESDARRESEQPPLPSLPSLTPPSLSEEL